MKKMLILICTLVFISSSAFGQEQEVRRVSGPRRQLATIIFAGLGGAVLGLSTLSFYGRPQEKLSNIAVGFALGVIVGTVMVTYKSASTRQYYEEEPAALLLNPEASGNINALNALEVMPDIPQTPIHESIVAESKWKVRPEISLGENGPVGPLDPRRENRFGAIVEYSF